MGKYKVVVTREAREDLSVIKKSGYKGAFKKASKIPLELEEHPETGIGNPKKLKHELSGNGRDR